MRADSYMLSLLLYGIYCFGLGQARYKTNKTRHNRHQNSEHRDYQVYREAPATENGGLNGDDVFELHIAETPAPPLENPANVNLPPDRYHPMYTDGATVFQHRHINISSKPGYFSSESLLVKFLRDRYKEAGRVARPLLNSSHTLKVEFAIAIIQILDFDETNQVLTTNVWKRYRWHDDLLVWRPEDFEGITSVRLPAEVIWTPDIVLYNNADVQEKKHEELVAVYSDGRVRWIPPAIYRSSCAIDMRNFPFDEQTCHFKFGSWTYDGDLLELGFYDSLVDLDLREYVDSSEWDILRTQARHHIRYYPCCGDEPYPDLTFYLTIQRRTAFYIYVLILPSVLLSSLTLVLFWIPPQRPDRTSLGMSLFSSFFVLLLILVQSSPPTSASISLLGVYYCINMVMIGVSTILSTVVINLTYYLQKNRVPAFLRVICIQGLSRLLCAKADVVLRDVDEDSPMVTGSRPISKHHVQHAHNVEWRILASVIDRICFLLYVVGIILSLIFVFPR